MPSLACPLNLDTRRLEDAVLDTYARVALNPSGEFHFNRGADYAVTQLGYDALELATLPAACTERFAGVGNPLAIAPLAPGATVLDVGSGAGMDLLLAARRIGPSGHALGVDKTAEMAARCRSAAREAGLANVEARLGDLHALPVADASVDVATSNGVLNLAHDKSRAFSELFRVLRPGGVLQIADIVVKQSLPDDIRDNYELWAS